MLTQFNVNKVMHVCRANTASQHAVQLLCYPPIEVHGKSADTTAFFSMHVM